MLWQQALQVEFMMFLEAIVKRQSQTEPKQDLNDHYVVQAVDAGVAA